MKINSYSLRAGKLQAGPASGSLPLTKPGGQTEETWYDVEEARPDELRQFLASFDLHPIMLGRCLDKANTAGVISFGKAVLMEYPVALDLEADVPAYISIVFQHPVLITVRHSALPPLDGLLRDLTAEKESGLQHLAQLVYLVLDELTDLSVQAETDVRDKIMGMARVLAKNPGQVRESDLSGLRWQVERLASLIENQLYCVTGLDASDNEALQEPHRKAYIEDLVSEVEIARQGIYRLESRVKDLFDSYQMAGNARVEKRLRILTIVSAITLPFGLIAGLLGMNVGGLPGMQDPNGFIIVIALMLVIAGLELWYFKRKGWFD
jgi:magnesium transporter